MIALFAGEDSYESYWASGTYAQKKSEELQIPLKVLNADDITSPEALMIEIESIDMFSTGSVIIAKRLFSNKTLVQFITEHFDHINQYDLIIWQDTKIDKRSAAIKRIQKNGIFKDFSLLKEWQLSKWLQEQAKKRNITLNTFQAERCIQITGTNKWILIQEIKKIGLYLEAKKITSLSDADLEHILGAHVRGDMWKLLDAYSAKDTTKTLSEFIKLSHYEDTSQYVITMLDREINLLTKIKLVEQSNQDFKSLGLHPFVLQQSIRKSQNFDLEQLTDMQYQLFLLDASIKKGKVDPHTGLIMYIIENTK